MGIGNGENIHSTHDNTSFISQAIPTHNIFVMKSSLYFIQGIATHKLKIPGAHVTNWYP